MPAPRQWRPRPRRCRHARWDAVEFILLRVDETEVQPHPVEPAREPPRETLERLEVRRREPAECEVRLDEATRRSARHKNRLGLAHRLVHGQHELLELHRPWRRLQEGRMFGEEGAEGTVEGLQARGELRRDGLGEDDQGGDDGDAGVKADGDEDRLPGEVVGEGEEDRSG